MGQPRPDPPTLPSPFLLLPWFPHCGLLWTLSQEATFTPVSAVSGSASGEPDLQGL